MIAGKVLFLPATTFIATQHKSDCVDDDFQIWGVVRHVVHKV